MRKRAVVREILLIGSRCSIGFRLLACFVVEISDDVGAVMTDDGFGDRTLQLVFSCEFTAMEDMFAYLGATFRRREIRVRIVLPLDEVFYEEFLSFPMSWKEPQTFASSLSAQMACAASYANCPT